MAAAGSRSIATGRWLAEVVLDAAPHVVIRDLATLRAHHGNLRGPELADALIRSATRATAGLGAIAGAVAGAEELYPPAWLAIPAELVVETLAVVAVEMKLVAELHEVFDRPVRGTPVERGLALAQAWAQRRGVSVGALAQPGAMSGTLGQTTRREIIALVQRRVARRTLRNLSSLAPFLTGAVVGAEMNRRATRSLGLAVASDLSGRGLEDLGL